MVLTRMGNIKEIEAIIERQIIQKTFIEYQKKIQISNSLSITIPLTILGLISEYNESLAEEHKPNSPIKEESEMQDIQALATMQVSTKDENLTSYRNKMLSQMHVAQYKYNAARKESEIEPSRSLDDNSELPQKKKEKNKQLSN
ncbi:MAG: hypothetical protein JWM09_471 [Francisellaceae bacterium]|nr:hypothetical protein [Francisellaceae bacterium]